MSEILSETSGEATPDLIRVTVGVPGVYGQPESFLAVLDLPAGLDLPAAWQAYNAAGGAIQRQGGGTLDHKKVGFDDWLLHTNAKQGANHLARVPIDMSNPSATEFPEGLETQSFFIPDFEELNPNIR